jgi:adenine specific DNA methylase Mod
LKEHKQSGDSKKKDDKEHADDTTNLSIDNNDETERNKMAEEILIDKVNEQQNV